MNHKPIIDRIKKLDKKVDSLNKDKSDLLNKITDVESDIDKVIMERRFFMSIPYLSPTLLFNYGRDKKYIYGQVYHNINPHSKKKKTFRFMLGKMSDYFPPKDYTQEEIKEIRVKLENLCIIKYTEKEILNKHI